MDIQCEHHEIKVLIESLSRLNEEHEFFQSSCGSCRRIQFVIIEHLLSLFVDFLLLLFLLEKFRCCEDRIIDIGFKESNKAKKTNDEEKSASSELHKIELTLPSFLAILNNISFLELRNLCLNMPVSS